jgi:hypothetical protein
MFLVLSGGDYTWILSSFILSLSWKMHGALPDFLSG